MTEIVSEGNAAFGFAPKSEAHCKTFRETLHRNNTLRGGGKVGGLAKREACKKPCVIKSEDGCACFTKVT